MAKIEKNKLKIKLKMKNKKLQIGSYFIYRTSVLYKCPHLKQNICLRSCIGIKRGNRNFGCNIVTLLSLFSMDMMNCGPFEYGNFWGDLVDQAVWYVWYLQPNSGPNAVCTPEEHYFLFEDEFHRCLCLECDKDFLVSSWDNYFKFSFIFLF